MSYNAGVDAARNKAPRCISSLRNTLLEGPPSEHFTHREGDVWVLKESPQSFIFGSSESALFSLGFWEDGDIGGLLSFPFAEIPGVIATDSNATLNVSPIYLEWEIETSEVVPRTLIFDPSAHGYEAEATMLDYSRPSQIKSRGYGEPKLTICKSCSRIGRFQFYATFRYADDLEQFEGKIPLEDLFEVVIFIGVCVDCNRAAVLFNSAL